MELWMNPACSKCRIAKEELDAAGVNYVERRYLDDPPTSAELMGVLARLGLEPWDIARPKETRELDVDLPRDATNRSEWLQLLVDNPRLIQRPIITADDGTATIARDPAALREVITRSVD